MARVVGLARGAFWNAWFGRALERFRVLSGLLVFSDYLGPFGLTRVVFWGPWGGCVLLCPRVSAD